MLLVLMQIGSPHLNVYSRLTTSPSSVDGTVYGHPHTVWLSCPRFGILTSSSEFTHAHIHCYQYYYEQDKAAMTMYISLITLFYYQRKAVGLTCPKYFCQEQLLPFFIKQLSNGTRLHRISIFVRYLWSYSIRHKPQCVTHGGVKIPWCNHHLFSSLLPSDEYTGESNKIARDNTGWC